MRVRLKLSRELKVISILLGVLFNSSYSRRLRIIVVYGTVVGVGARLSVPSVYTREDSGDWDEREIPPKTFQRDLVALSGYYLRTRSIVCLLFNNTRYGLTLGFANQNKQQTDLFSHHFLLVLRPSTRIIFY